MKAAVIFLRVVAGVALAFAIIGYAYQQWAAAVGDTIILVVVCVGLWLLTRYERSN